MTSDAHPSEVEDASTQFLKAAALGLVDQVRSYLQGDHGTIDVNIQGLKDRMQTALETACSYGHAAVVELLLEDERTDLNLQYPFHMACADGRTEIVRKFLKIHKEQQEENPKSKIPKHRKIDLEATDRKDCTALLLAIKHGQASVVQELLEAGADPMASMPVLFSFNHGKSALILACGSNTDNCWPIAQNILSHIPSELQRASLNQGDPSTGKTPLMYAVESRHHQMMREFLLMGAEVNQPDRFGETPLFRSDDSDTMRILLDHGANMNATNLQGDTALHLAIRSKNISIIQALIECGANLNQPNDEGFYPIHVVANRCMHYSSCRHLVDRKGDRCDVLTELLKYDKVNYESPVKKRPKTQKEQQGESPTNRFELLQEFQNISIETPTVHGHETLLHIACREFRYSLVRKLLSDHHANIHAVDAHGNTPLHLVCASRDVWCDSKLQLIELLLTYLPDVHAANKDGDTPLLLAATSMNTLSLDVIWLLVLRGVSACGSVFPPRVLPPKAKTKISSVVTEDVAANVLFSLSTAHGYVPRVSESPREQRLHAPTMDCA